MMTDQPNCACAPECVAVLFAIEADAEPGLAPRLLQPFARRGIIPDYVHAELRGGQFLWQIGVADVSTGDVALLAGNLRQVVGVRGVAEIAADALRLAA